MSTAKFHALLESLSTQVHSAIGFDDLNYDDSFLDHSATQDTEEAEKEVEEVVAEERRWR